MLVRRIYSIITAVAVMIVTVSCRADETKLLDYQKGLENISVEWEYGLESYTADITFDGDIPSDPASRRSATVNFTSPEEITGLAVKYTNDTTEASVGKVKLELPDNTGEELYLVVRLFSLYPDEIAEEKADLAKFRSVINGSETEFLVNYKNGIPETADITWDTGAIKVKKIGVER